MMDADRAYVEVRVSGMLQDFIAHYYGGNPVQPGRRSQLWCLLKQHLSTTPRNCRQQVQPGPSIRIILPNVHGAKIYSYASRRKVTVDTRYRNYLSVTGEKIIRNYFRALFKQTFYSYMAGCVTADSRQMIMTHVESFLVKYGLDPTKENEDSLLKEWYRYRRQPHNSLDNFVKK